MKNIYFYCLTIIIALHSCTISINDKLIEKLETDSSTLVLESVVTFEWDKMYLFGEATDPEQISKSLKQNYGGGFVQAGKFRMIFTKDNKIVHEENVKQLNYSNSFIIFEAFPDSAHNQRSFYCQNSEVVFKVEKGKIENSCSGCYYFKLHPTLKE